MKKKEDSDLHEKKFNERNNEQNEIIKEHPESMLAVLINSMKEGVLNANPRTRQDSVENYKYFKKHYWDG